MEPESNQHLVELKVPGRWVVYPKDQTKEQAEEVLTSPCLSTVKFCGDMEITMLGVPFKGIVSKADAFNSKPYNYRFICPELPNGVGLGIFHTVEPEQLHYLQQAFDAVRDWFNSYANQIEPQFFEIRTEIEKYIREDYMIYPAPKGFIEWFIAFKIGGCRIELNMPFDETDNIISGGNGSIKYIFSDLWNIVNTRIDSSLLFEYTEFRQKEEDAKRNKRETEKHIKEFENFLIGMRDERVRINRKVVVDFVESVNSNLILKMAQDGKPYTPLLKDYLNEMLVIAEQSMIHNEPLSVFNALTNAAAHAEKEIRRLEWRREEAFIRNSASVLKETNKNIRAFELVVNFWTLLRREYTLALQSVEQSEPLKNTGLPALPANRQPTHDEMRKAVRETLAPLGGHNPQGRKIISDVDYTRLIEYTDHLVLKDALPTDIQIIQQADISNKHIRFTFYRLHKRLFTTFAIRGNFILLIHSLFRQFENVQDSTTRTKFSESPKSYYKDFKILEEVI